MAKAMRVLHQSGWVHGKLNLETACKFEDNWKLSDVLGCQRIGETTRITRISSCSPPECFEPLDPDSSKHEASFKSDYTCSAMMDSWGFGKLAYEVLTGRELFQVAPDTRFEDDHHAMLDLMHWNSFNCQEVHQDLLRVGVLEAGADLISRCLAPHPRDRPTSDQILKDDVWRQLRHAI